LRCQIEEIKKLTKQAVKSPSSAVHGDDGESNIYLSSSSHEKEPHRRSRGGREPSTNFDDLKLNSWTLKVNLTQMSLLNG